MLPDGGQRIQQCTATAVPNSTGCGFHTLLAFQDVTGITRRNDRYKVLRSQALHEVEVRKEAEHQLRASRQRLTIALENANIEFWEWNLATGVYQRGKQTPILVESFDRLRALVGRTGIVPEDAVRSMAALQAHLDGHTAIYKTEYSTISADGSRHWFSDTGRVVERGSADEPLHIIGTHLDITDRKHAEEDRVNLAIEQRKVDILANFIRNVAHEFRNPLMVINTRLYRLKKPIDAPTYQQQLTNISEQVDYINNLVNDMFLMTMLDAGLDFKSLPVTVNTLLQNVVTEHQAAAQKQDVALVLDIIDTPLTIRGDGPKLHQAFTNVVENALQNTSSGGRVLLAMGCTTDQLVIEVRDTGQGIPAEHLHHIFERFYRVDDARTERRAGLGLTITQKIITLHNGTIQVTSQPDKGTTVQITLPCAPA